MPNGDLVARREAVMDEADRALESAWPERKGHDYVEAMRAAAAELEQIAGEMMSAGVPAVEQSRALRYRGSILADLAPALGSGMLEQARTAYLMAEALLRDQDDAVERAKLDFNFGNTLRQLDPNDEGQLREAERRFLAASEVFSRSAPQYLPQVEEALASTRSLLSIVPVAKMVEDARDDMEELSQQMTQGEDSQEVAARMKEIMERGGGPAAILGRIQGLVNELPDSAKEDPRYSGILEQLETAASLGAGGAGSADPEVADIMSQLQDRLQSEAEAGHVSADRAAVLRDALGKLSRVAGSGDEDLAGLMRNIEGIFGAAEAMFEANHYLSHGIERPPEASRAAALVEMCWALRLAILREGVQRGKSQGESTAVMELTMRASKLDRRIYEAGGDDTRALSVEREGLRPFASEVRRFAARHYPMLARPVWAGDRVPLDSNAVLFAGSPELLETVTGVCDRLGLDLVGSPKGTGVADARWRQLQRASIGVFDLTANEGPARASVAYELGIARTLGRPVVVLAGHDQTVPFDIDITPTLVHGDGRDETVIANALDEAMVWVMPRPKTDTVEEAITDAIERYSPANGDVYVDQTLKQLRRMRDEPGPLEDAPDPIAVGDALASLVTYLDDSAVMLLHPVWPPSYGSRQVRRLFHVMPFRPDWAEEAAGIAEKACVEVGVEYVRGDRVEDADIIRSIWKEINLATHVLVDLTGFNLNVAIELGIADTLGRETLLVGQADTVDQLFPTIAKRRFYSYSDAGGHDLFDHVRSFLS